MAKGKDFQRPPDGFRFKPGSMNLVKPFDQIGEGEYAYLRNVRAYLQERIQSRNPISAPIQNLQGNVYSARRLNDSTPAGPVVGYANVSGANNKVWVGDTAVAQGVSGNPLSMCPFRPNASVQPWMYIADLSQVVATLVPSIFSCFGMLKVRSDGTCYKWGIKEPQLPPVVGTASSTVSGSATLTATAWPWTNVGGANAGFNYGHSNVSDGTAPLLIIGLSAGSTVSLTIGGTATINGAAKTPISSQINTSSFPGYYVYPGSTSPTSVVIGAFTDGAGAVVAGSLSTPNPINVGAGGTFTVPPGASQLQVGVDSAGNTFSSNSGSFSAVWTVVTSNIATKVSTLGNVTGYYWGDSPHTGPVGSYIWRNPTDTGGGTVRTISNAAGSTTSNSWELDSTPQDGTVAMLWNTLDATGTVTGSVPLFSPALESAGFQDFNACFVGSLFFPSAGTYSFTFVNKDQIMVGMGGGASVAGGAVTGTFGQTISVVNGLPLVYVSVPNGTGGAATQTVNISVPASGAYSVEIDYDYWEHTGRSMHMTVNGATIPPIQSAVRTNVSYTFVYRSSATGAVSNPAPFSTAQSTPVLGNTITPIFSPDPQVDKIDYYRQDAGLANYTYVATGPNTSPPTTITDTLTDLAVANNPILQFDNFEPFPSIDLPKSGIVNITGNTISWVSGDKFNTRWLPGTVILIGLPTGAASPLPPQVAYSFIARPTSTTTMNIPGIQSGTGYVYNIAEPLLAAQPLPAVWGPTDNTAFMFGCGDAFRPGTLYFTKGNAPDSAPDTNQIEVTSPSEPLMNGCIVNGLGMVFSSERAWLIYPTFLQALATTTGVTGSQFSLTESITNRGLFMRYCICVEGGHTVFFRAKDGIYASPGGAGSVSLTDSQLYNLFPHEGSVPINVQIANFTVVPPDDTQPKFQQLSFSTGYLYYDYLGIDGGFHNLVYDVAAKGWSVDTYGSPVVVHALAEGPNINDTLIGCADGTLRTFDESAAENVLSVVATGAFNNGDARAKKNIGDIFFKGLITADAPVAMNLYKNSYQTIITDYSPGVITGVGTLVGTVIDFDNGLEEDVVDLAATFQWQLDQQNYLEFWQPTLLSQPSETEDRVTDWDDLGTPINKFIQGGLIEADTGNIPKTFSLERADDLTVFTPNEAPMTFTQQSIQAFTFTPPFLAHSLRRVTSDGVLWKAGPEDGWRYELIWKPYPESTIYWATEGITHGLKGFQHVFQINLVYVSNTPVVVTINWDSGQTTTQTFPITTPAGSLFPSKNLLKMPPAKGKVANYVISSDQPFYLWKEEMEVFVHQWGETIEYHIVNPFGGPSAEGAEV